MKICVATKADGNPCEAAALADSDHCFFHDPNKAAERREAQAEGGRHNRMMTLDPAAPVRRILSHGDIIERLSETIDNVEKGLLDPRIGNSVGYLTSLLSKALERRDTEERLEKLERALENQIPEVP